MEKSSADTNPFGLHYVGNNLAHAWSFFGDLSVSQPNNFLVLILGLPATGFFLYHVIRYGLNSLSHWEQVYLAMLPPFVLLFALIMGYNWGQLDDPIAQRLTLPFFLPLVFAIVWSIYSKLKTHPLHYPAVIIYTVFVFIYIWPTKARHVYDDRYIPGQQLEWCKDFIEQNAGRDYVMVSDWPFFWIAHGIEAITIDQLNQNKNKLKYQLSTHPEKEFLACTRTIYYREKNTEESLHDLVPLDKVFVLELEKKKQFTIFNSMQISKITDVADGVAEPYRPSSPDPDANDYFWHYFNNLP